jgi:hypothetical protein
MYSRIPDLPKLEIVQLILLAVEDDADEKVEQ